MFKAKATAEELKTLAEIVRLQGLTIHALNARIRDLDASRRVQLDGLLSLTTRCSELTGSVLGLAGAR